MQKITPFLWFDDCAEEAANFYTSIFPDSEILGISRQGNGTVMTVSFRLRDQEFTALNGGPTFQFAEGISLFVNCETQAEVDELWEKLSDGGGEGQCGWLKDRYGVSWQIIPTALGEALGDPDPARAQRALNAMLQMSKIDINRLNEAREGVAS